VVGRCSFSGILISKTFQNKKYLNIALDRVLKIIKEEIKA